MIIYWWHQENTPDTRPDALDMTCPALTSRHWRKSLHLEPVPTPELGPGEALVAVMASAINYNTVWTSIFEPMPTFGFLKRYGRTSPLAKRHGLPYHVVGSDLSGVVLRTGPGVHVWKPGDQVVTHCLSVELERPEATTTRCSTPSSGSGASRRTSAGWLNWPWSNPTS
jgi:NADPH:quinone reductase-like Zn-dependent oxidoreductase